MEGSLTAKTGKIWFTKFHFLDEAVQPCPYRYNPEKKQHRKWENAMTLDKKSWGNRKDATIEDFLTPQVWPKQLLCYDFGPLVWIIAIYCLQCILCVQTGWCNRKSTHSINPFGLNAGYCDVQTVTFSLAFPICIQRPYFKQRLHNRGENRI